MGSHIVFWILAAVIVVSAALVVSLKNIFHCAICLIVALSGVAGIFVLLNAPFVAAVQVLIYVGAVSVLMIFAIMLTSNLAVKKIVQTNRRAVPTALVCFVFVLGVVALLRKTGVWNLTDKPLPDDSIKMIGTLLMTEYMLPFEVVSVLLLAALIGAIVLARGERS